MNAYSTKELIVKIVMLKGEKGDAGDNVDSEARELIADEETTRAQEIARLENLISNPTIADGSITTEKLADEAVTEDKLADEAVTEDKLDGGAVTADKIAEDAVRLRFTNVSVAAISFVSDSTYADYPFRAAITLTGATAEMKPDVCFGLADAISGIFAPVAESYAGGIYIYSSEVPDAAITIPVIDLVR